MKSQKLRNCISVISPKRKRGQDSSPRLRFGLVGLLLILPATAQAQSDSNNPYNLTIVVHVADNRLLTDVFRKNIERELHDGFQAALGDMGRVRVTHEHSRLDDVVARGLRSLDDWKDREDRKTHFVLIDYSGVHYEIQTRQYDGTIGRASPVVRRDQTRDRDFVAKAATLLIKKDFGILGTVKTEPEGAKNQVKVELRGGGLGDMSRWVKKDDVFFLAPPDGGSPLALKWSLLQVEQAPAEDARDGQCVCRLFHRYVLKSIAGYRCIKVGTVQAPLRLRWIQNLPGGRAKPLDQRLTVEIRRYGFEGEETTMLPPKSSDFNGVLETVRDGKEGVFNNVAFVRVIDGLGETKPPQVPIALVADQPVFIDVTAAKDSGTLFTFRKTQWQSRVADSVQMQAYLFKRLETLGGNPANRAETIEAATSGMNRAKEDRISLQGERQKLEADAKDNNKVLNTPIEDRRLRQLEDYERALGNYLAEQKKIEDTENDPKRKRWLSEIESAKLLVEELEIGKAIQIYERIKSEGYENADLDKHLEKLRQDWKTKDKDHEEARGFIYRVWPTVELERLGDKIAEAQKTFKKCKDVGDLISIRKLLKGTETHADRLTKKLAELRPDLIINDEKEAQQYKKVSEQIAKLGEDVQEYLKAHAGDK